MEIRLENIKIQFPGMESPLLEIEERVIASGSRLLIRGPSGSGKTTLLHLIAGLQDPHGGRVVVDGRPLEIESENERCEWRRSSVGIVFQRLNLLGHLTALENALLAAPDSGLSKEDATKALGRLGVDDLANQFAYNLSLGEQQRVAVARVTAQAPTLILADEPTSSLDERNAGVVADTLFESTRADGTLIVATHDDRIADRFDEVWTLGEPPSP